MWGERGSGEGQFESPMGVTVDPFGNVYVADTGNGRVEKFDPVGKFIAAWESRASGEVQFFALRDAALDHSGNIYTLDGETRIRKIDSNGHLVMEWTSPGTLPLPFDLAVDHSGNVYVIPMHGSYVQKFDAGGNLVKEWGSFGTGDGQFWHMGGVAVDDGGYVYVSDFGESDDHRIQKFDSDGNFVTKWGSKGTENDQFNTPGDLTVDARGHVYVIDSGVTIKKFDSNGNFITKWGTYGSEDGQFGSATGIAVDSLGYVYVTDDTDSDNPLIRQYHHKVKKFDPEGNFITKWGSWGIEPGQFSGPDAVAVDLLGNVYVVDSGNSRIQKFYPVPIISLTPQSDTHFNACSVAGGAAFAWSEGEHFTKKQVQFSSNRNFDTVPVKVRVSDPAKEVQIGSAPWKKVLSLPGSSGGFVYWRVAGTRTDNTSYASETYSIVIDAPRPVGNSSISPTVKSSLPTLTWETNCSTRFKVWFGSDSSFTRNKAFSFAVKDPGYENFSKILTKSQWGAIKRLVNNVTGSTIYWYVESWDSLKRYSKTDVMSFVLTD